MEECDDGEEGGRRGTGNFRVGDEGSTLCAPVPKRVCVQNGRPGLNLDPIRVPPRDSSVLMAATFRGRRLVDSQTSRGRDLEWVQAVGDQPRGSHGRGEWVSPSQPIMTVTPDTRLRSVQQPRVGTNFFAPGVKDVGRDARGGSMQSDDEIGGGVRLLTALTEASGVEDLGSSGHSQVSGERAERGYSVLLQTVGRGPRRKGAFAAPASRKDRPLGGDVQHPTRSEETRRARRVLVQTQGLNMVTRSRGLTGATSGGSVGGEDGGASSSRNQSGVVSAGGGCVGEPYSYTVGEGLFPFQDLVAGPQVVRADKDKLIAAMERAISNEDDFMKSNADVDCVFVELTENLETALVEASGCMVTLGSNRTKFNFSTVREEVVVYVQYMLPWMGGPPPPTRV